MKRAALAISLIILLSFSPMVQADHDALTVMLLVENKEYLDGTSGNLTVHIFKKADHVDPDRLPAVKVLGPSDRDIPVFRVALGVYNGTFVARDEDVVANFIRIQAGATHGKASAEDRAYDQDSFTARIPYMNSFNVGIAIVNMTDIRVKPGTRITVHAGVTPHPGASFDFYAEYRDMTGVLHKSPFEAKPLPEPSVRSGLYSGQAFEGVYIVPSLPYSLEISLVAHARYGPANRTASMTVSSDFFCVIYHNISKNETETVFDILVSDESGNAVPGAIVKLNCFPDDYCTNGTWLNAGVTSSSGCTRVRMRYEQGTRTINVAGVVGARGKTQRFSGAIDIVDKSSFEPDGPGFQVISDLQPEEIHGQGEVNFSWGYTAYYNSTIWVNESVYCYLLTNSYEGWAWTSAIPSHSLIGALSLASNETGGFLVKSSGYRGRHLILFVKSAIGIHPVFDRESGQASSSDGLFYATDRKELVDYRGSGQGADPNCVIKPAIHDGLVHVSINGMGRVLASWLPAADWKETSHHAFRAPYPKMENPEWRIWANFENYLESDGDWPSESHGDIPFPKSMPTTIPYYVHFQRLERPYSEEHFHDFGFAGTDDPETENRTLEEETIQAHIVIDTTSMSKINLTLVSDDDAAPHRFLPQEWPVIDAPQPAPEPPGNSRTIGTFSSIVLMIALIAIVSTFIYLVSRQRRR